MSSATASPASSENSLQWRAIEMWVVLSILSTLAGNKTIMAIFAALVGGIRPLRRRRHQPGEAGRGETGGGKTRRRAGSPRNGPRGDRCRTRGARPPGRSGEAGGNAMGKALILCLLLAGCTMPVSPDNPRQVWCDHNQLRRPSAVVVAAMTRPELDEVNAYNGKGARWCGWRPWYTSSSIRSASRRRSWSPAFPVAF
jgi:hypothetical protein